MTKNLISPNNLIAANIRNARKIRNYSQEYLAQSLSISQNAYSKLERGYTELTINRIFQVAQILEMPVDELLILPPKPDFALYY